MNYAAGIIVILTVLITVLWIVRDKRRTEQRIRPIHYRPLTVCPIQPEGLTREIEDVEARVFLKMKELERMKDAKGSTVDPKTILKRQVDFSQPHGSDTRILKAIDVKIEAARTLSKQPRRRV